ncbi:MAG: putative toxin-antitoxin system toxin component, PIN family [Actinomycetota bacterium]|nr:putative toxin-antitoxin system toxin component, PIN family [Actinomycetota bacterium]
MRSNLRCVFDTNILISALLFDESKPARALFAALHNGKVLVSADTISELNEVLSREKFDKYLAEEERELFLPSLLQSAKLVEIHEKIRVCRDPKDDKFLELAVNGAADYIVSGDGDLLALHPFRNVQILTPETFLSTIQR